MKKVSIFNIKGGVAKTTSTANLGACLSQEGKKVLLVDLDPQSNLTKLFKAYSMDDLTVSDVLLDKHLDIHKVIKKTDFENIDILPANINLTFADRNILIDNTRSQQNRLSKALKNLNNEYNSLRLFSIGVPLRAILCLALSNIIAFVVCAFTFFM